MQRRRRWTPGDDLTLEALWGEGLRLTAIAKQLRRTPATTYWRAQRLGLPLGVPDGFEYLSAAAARTGFTSGQLTRIMRAAGKKVRTTLSRTATGRHRHMHFVAPEDADSAVAAWVKRETPQEAARRLGLSADRLRVRLAKVGIANAPGSRRRIWVTDAEVARANAVCRWRRIQALGGLAVGAEGER